MIKMIAGVFGLRVEQPNGQFRVVGMGPDSGPFSASPELEARLVAEKRAVYVTAPEDPDMNDSNIEPGAGDTDNDVQPDAGAPIGFDETPPENMTEDDEEESEEQPLDTMNAKELRDVGATYGLTFRIGMTNAEMIDAIKAKQAELDSDVEDAPAFDASEAVQ